MKKLCALFLICVFCLLPASAFAGNLSFLKDSALGKLHGEDLEAFEKTLVDVLENKADRESATWKNTKTGSGGKVTALKSFEYKGLKCRKIKIRNKVEDVSDKEIFDFCKKEDSWKILSVH